MGVRFCWLRRVPGERRTAAGVPRGLHVRSAAALARRGRPHIHLSESETGFWARSGSSASVGMTGASSRPERREVGGLSLCGVAQFPYRRRVAGDERADTPSTTTGKRKQGGRGCRPPCCVRVGCFGVALLGGRLGRFCGARFDRSVCVSLGRRFDNLDVNQL